MPFNITKGRRPAAVRGVFYGTPGIGKSSLAAHLPGALFLDVEKSTQEIETAERHEVIDWLDLEARVKDLTADSMGYQTAVIDTVDQLEIMLIERLTKREGNKGIGEWGGGFNQGYVMLGAEFAKLLKSCTALAATGMNVIFVAHAKTQKVSPPDQVNAYDRYELKLSKHVAPLLIEWATLVLFLNYRLDLVKGRDGKIKGTGGQDRVIFANRTAAWEAKNRYGLPDEIEWGASPAEAFAQIAHVFTSTPAPTITAEVVAKQDAAAVPTVDTPEANKEVVYAATADQVKELNALGETVIGRQMIAAKLDEVHGVGVDELSAEEAAGLIAGIKAEVKTPAGGGLEVPADVEAWLDGGADKVNAYLVKVKWIEPGQTWRALSSVNMASMIAKSDKFAKAAGIPPLAGKEAA